MNFGIPTRIHIVILTVTIVGFLPFISHNTSSAYGQFGNSISGFVYGLERKPVADIDVELLDDLSRTVGRTRTNGSGRYVFNGMGSGRFTVRVLAFATDYQEQDGEIEIINFSSQSGSGLRIGGHSNEQKDFYLKLKKGVAIAAAGSFFAQDVPADAKKLYDKGIAELDHKLYKDGQSSLRAAIDIFPKYYAALERLGNENIRMGNPESYMMAESLFKSAVEVNPRGYKSWYGLAYARYALSKNTEALAAVQKAVELNSNWTEAVLLAGSLLRQAKRYDESEKQLLKAKELSKSTNADVHWQLALLYANGLKRYADAARELKLFLKVQPDTKDAESIKKLIADFEAKAQKT